MSRHVNLTIVVDDNGKLLGGAPPVGEGWQIVARALREAETVTREPPPHRLTMGWRVYLVVNFVAWLMMFLFLRGWLS